MALTITVVPKGSGWTVWSEATESEIFFCSGARAEAAARLLGAKIALAGQPVDVLIFLRDGALGGQFAFRPLGVDGGPSWGSLNRTANPAVEHVLPI
jgi:hypothetical protein